MKQNPEWNERVAGADATHAGQIGFVMAATWPDRIKFEQDQYKGENPGNPDVLLIPR